MTDTTKQTITRHWNSFSNINNYTNKHNAIEPFIW